MDCIRYNSPRAMMNLPDWPARDHESLSSRRIAGTAPQWIGESLTANKPGSCTK